MKENLLIYDNFSAGYGHMEIIHNISFDVSQSEIVAIIGPNGAGKSTIFRALFGLATKRSGKIYFKGKYIKKLDSNYFLRNGLVYLPQKPSLFPEMTVRENIEMGAYVKKQRKDNDVERILRDYPLIANNEQRLACELSGGEQKIVEIGRSMILNPELLLIDEPSAGLSPIVTKEIFDQLIKLRKKGMTIVIIEQAVNQVLKIADRVIVIKAGELAFEGKPVELLKTETMRQIIFGAENGGNEK